MLKNTGVNIGKSVCDEGYKNLVEEIIKKSETHNCQIYYPLDVVVSKTLDGNGITKEINEINNDEMILDIGPKDYHLAIKKIIKESNTVLWNGPAGYFENPNFAKWNKTNFGNYNMIKKLKMKFMLLQEEGKLLQ